MYIVLFRSRLSDEAGSDYQDMAGDMLQLAKAQPGFIDFTQYTGDDGERLSVIRWKNKETPEAWRDHEQHRVAQNKGRERWYAYYHLEIAELVRESRFDKTEPTASRR